MAKTPYNKMSENKKELPDSVELAKRETTAKPKKTSKVKLIRVIIINGLNIRKGPGKEFDAVDVLKYGTSATVSEFKKASDGTDWAKLASGKGWIMYNPTYVAEIPITVK